MGCCTCQLGVLHQASSVLATRLVAADGGRHANTYIASQ